LSAIFVYFLCFHHMTLYYTSLSVTLCFTGFMQMCIFSLQLVWAKKLFFYKTIIKNPTIANENGLTIWINFFSSCFYYTFLVRLDCLCSIMTFLGYKRQKIDECLQCCNFRRLPHSFLSKYSESNRFEEYESNISA